MHQRCSISDEIPYTRTDPVSKVQITKGKIYADFTYKYQVNDMFSVP